MGINNTSKFSTLDEQSAEPTKYVVVRDGHRVSDRDFLTSSDEAAIAELNFWKRVSNRFPDGTKIEIVPFNKKIHRIY
jgi:hypothetical protein